MNPTANVPAFSPKPPSHQLVRSLELKALNKQLEEELSSTVATKRVYHFSNQLKKVNSQSKIASYNPKYSNGISVALFFLIDGSVLATSSVCSKKDSFNRAEAVFRLKTSYIEANTIDVTPFFRHKNQITTNSIKAINHVLSTLTTPNGVTPLVFPVPARVKSAPKYSVNHTLLNVDEDELLLEAKTYIVANSGIKGMTVEDLDIKFYFCQHYGNSQFEAGLYGTTKFINDISNKYLEDDIRVLPNGGYTIGIITSKKFPKATYVISSKCYVTDQFIRSLGRKTALRNVTFKPETIVPLDTSNYEGTNLEDNLIAYVLGLIHQQSCNVYIGPSTLNPETTLENVGVE